MEIREQRIALIEPMLRQHYAVRTLGDFPEVRKFVDGMIDPKHVRADAILAVIFYGSCLNPGMQSQTSTPDYYIIVHSYRGFFGTKRLALLNRWMPPNIFRFEESKYSVISLYDLERETSEDARDVYNMGRFSKYLAMAHVRDAETHKHIVRHCASAMEMVLWRALPLLPRKFTLDEAIMMALKLSYLGEPRVEADNKVAKIFKSQETFYREVFGTLLQHMMECNPWIRTFSQQPGHYFIEPPVEELRETQSFIRASRVRAFLRWPKFAFTVDNWADYLIAKVERTQGVHIELKPHERRFPFIYGWKYLWQLKRRNLFK